MLYKNLQPPYVLRTVRVVIQPESSGWVWVCIVLIGMRGRKVLKVKEIKGDSECKYVHHAEGEIKETHEEKKQCGMPADTLFIGVKGWDVGEHIMQILVALYRAEHGHLGVM